MGRIFCVLFFIGICVCTKSFASEKIYLPATPSSIPLLLASQEIDGVEAHVYTNHSQAHSLFLRGETNLLVTGVSVGRVWRDQGRKIEFIHSPVLGLSYLVTGKDLGVVQSFKDLVGKTLYLPFPGSPLEEVTQYLASKEGLDLQEDVSLGYGPFSASMQLLAEGKIDAAVFPEPFASLVESRGAGHVSFGLAQFWQKYNKQESGYPQVALLGQKDWVESNKALIDTINEYTAKMCLLVQDDPEGAVKRVSEYFALDPHILVQAVARTEYSFLEGENLEEALKSYYSTIER